MNQYRYYKDIQVLKESKSIGRPLESIVYCLEFKSIESHQLSRLIYLSSNGVSTKYDIEHDKQEQMHEYENDISIDDYSEISKHEFEALWVNVSYEE